LFDKRMLTKMDGLLGGLSTAIEIRDRQGRCLRPQGGSAFERLEDLAEGKIQRFGDRLYLRSANRLGWIFSVAGDNEDLLRMANALLTALIKAEGGNQSAQDVYRRVLKEELSGTEMEALAHEQSIALEQDRCVLLFQIVQTGNTSAYALLSEIIPQSEKDCLVEMDRHLVALVKDMAMVESADELNQFAQAVCETLISETAHQAVVGIGQPRMNLGLLGESYREARRAMEVGRIFRPQETICQFSRLMLERFLTELNPEVSMYYHKLLFNRKTARLFNEEMLYTIEMFFKKDLNLSDTARQLYIHRNTLVYRLDKVQRLTGLDLRRFEDAVTFKILLELKKCGSEKPAAIH